MARFRVPLGHKSTIFVCVFLALEKQEEERKVVRFRAFVSTVRQTELARPQNSEKSNFNKFNSRSEGIILEHGVRDLPLERNSASGAIAFSCTRPCRVFLWTFRKEKEWKRKGHENVWKHDLAWSEGQEL